MQISIRDAADPLVTILTPFLNPGSFLQESIDSVRAQSMGGWELLLIDDGSTDISIDIARRNALLDPARIRCLEHPGHGHRGASASRNLGLRQASGAYVTFLDADDVYLPDKLATQVAALEAHPSVSMIYGNTLYWHTWNHEEKESGRDFVPDLGVPLNAVIDPPFLLSLLYPLGVVTAPSLNTVMVRRAAAERLCGFEDAFALAYSDQSLLVKFYAEERVLVVSECLDKYRQHQGSSSSIVERTGQYGAIRSAFLLWLTEYLRARGIDDPLVWAALARCRSAQV